MILFPNAKINFGLHVLSKRADNYHNLETVMVPVGLCDILEFLPYSGKETRFELSGIPVTGDMAGNLVYKAYILLKDQFSLPVLQIHLHKMIPSGAGLGGGSSDAAFMLKGLNEFFNLKISPAELKKLAASLGSDCSFFIDNKTSLVTGTGDIVEPCRDFTQGYRLLVFYPGFHVSTSDAYGGITPVDSRESIQSIAEMEAESWKNKLVNDFEKTIFKKYPVIKDLKERIYRHGALYASMSGSGSAVYGLFEKDFKTPAGLKTHLVWEGTI